MSTEQFSSRLFEISDIIYLTLYSIECIFIVTMLKFKIDKAGLITMACYQGAFVSKVAGNYIYDDHTIERELVNTILHNICNMLIAFSHTYFIF
jgi:hypothetical protein